MAIRNIVKKGDEFLFKKSKEVTEFSHKLHLLIDDMRETMYKAEGAGIAAVQIGVLKRIVVIDIEGTYIELINPVIVKATGEQECLEGCLSVPGVFGYTDRPLKVTVKAYDRNGKQFKFIGTKNMAKAICHELDHLEGKLFLEKVKRFVEN